MYCVKISQYSIKIALISSSSTVQRFETVRVLKSSELVIQSINKLKQKFILKRWFIETLNKESKLISFFRMNWLDFNSKLNRTDPCIGDKIVDKG